MTMELTYVEILGSDGAIGPNLGLTRQTRDALRRYCELRWPTGRRKGVEREWELSPDEARGVCEGTASATTIDKIWKHPRGGWAVALLIMGAVIGQGADEWMQAERKRHAQLAGRYRSLGRDLRAVAPDPRLRADQLDSGNRRERGSFRG